MPKTISHKSDLPYFGDAPLLDISISRSFSSLIFESISGIRPTEQENKLFELILNLTIDHGSDTPSAKAVIDGAKLGKNISQAVANGILQINEVHGGAIEPAMKLLYEIKNNNLNVPKLVSQYFERKEKIPGFGHRIYEIDPRTELLYKLSENLNLSQEFINITKKIQSEIYLQKNKNLPINIDGSIAAILCTFGWDPSLGTAVFITARTPGLCAHFLANI